MKNNQGTIPHISATLPGFERTNKKGELLRLCSAKQIKFVDPEFKPQFSSLFKGSPDLADRYKWRDFQWARAVDVLGEEEFSLFNEISPQSLIHGQLENSYFMCVMSALAERPALIRRLFDADKPNQEGLYAVWLNLSGGWQQILVDDFFPIEIHGNACEFAFSRTQEDEIWPLILEKAYAKAFGSYDLIAAGNLMHTLRDLTGAPYEVLENIGGDCEELWRILVSACEKNYVIVCLGSELHNHVATGLILPGHSHNVVDCVEVNDSFGRPTRLVLVRNVWSNWKWTGDWSDKSHLWTEELKRKLADWEDEEGLCWLSIQDFVQFYQTVGVCQVEPFFYYNSIKIDDIIGIEKHIIRFDVDASGTYTISIDQLDPRISSHVITSKDIKGQMSYFRVLIGKLTNSDIEFKACRLSHLRSTFVQAKLEIGSYVALVDSYWSKQSMRKFSFGVYGPGKSGIRKLSPNESAFHGSEFEVWRNFSLTCPGKFTRQGTYIVGENTHTATISKFNLQDMRYGISLNRWDHDRGQVSVVKGFTTANRRGLEVVTESGYGQNHFVTLNPSWSSVEIFKLDPRCNEFSVTQKPIAMELVDNQLPGNKSVRNLLMAYSAEIPSYSSSPNNKPQAQNTDQRLPRTQARNSENKEDQAIFQPEVKRQAPPKSQRQSHEKENNSSMTRLDRQQPSHIRRASQPGTDRHLPDNRPYESRAGRPDRGNYGNAVLSGHSDIQPAFGNRDLARPSNPQTSEDCRLI